MKSTRLLSTSLVFFFSSTLELFGARGVFREYPIPTTGGGPTSITRSFEGELWFTEFAANKIGRISARGEITEYVIPTANSGPLGIAAFTDGIWFTEFNANKIGRITPAGSFTEFPIPTPASGPHGITGSFYGGIWFTEFNGNRIGRITPEGVITEFAIPTPDSGPVGIVYQAAAGLVWFTEFRGNKLGQMPREGGTIQEINLPNPNSGPADITTGILDRIWFTEFRGNRIGTIEGLSSVVEFDVPTPSSGPWGINAPQNGTVWFTERLANKIGSLDFGGTYHFGEYSVPTPDSEPTGIFAASAHVWFTEQRGQKIGRLARDALLFVGSGVSGSWDTEYRFANPNSSVVAVSLTSALEGGQCLPRFCFGQTALLVFARGTTSLKASGFGQGFRTTYVRGFPQDRPPTVTARVFNTARPSQGIEIPSIYLTTLAERDPFVLAFPSARRGPNVHSNLVLGEVGWFDGITLLVEALSREGVLLGSESIPIESGRTIFLIDVLSRLGVDQLQEGQILVTRTGGTGLMWGVLATLSDEGTVLVSPGANP